jgi:DNA-binding NarL/FixJ family response regulator
MSTRILLVDDHKIVLGGLRSLLKQNPHLEVIAEACDGVAAVKAAQELRPDVVIMDVTLPKLNGIEATRQILAKLPNVKVIALSMHTDQLFVMEMFKAGARGYMLKDDDFDELLAAIRAVMKDELYLSPTLADLTVRDYLRYTPASTVAPVSFLSNREHQFMQLLANGKTIKEIAAELHLSPKTLYTHRENIMRKLHLNNYAELIKTAIQYFVE